MDLALYGFLLVITYSVTPYHDIIRDVNLALTSISYQLVKNHDTIRGFDTNVNETFNGEVKHNYTKFHMDRIKRRRYKNAVMIALHIYKVL